MKNVLITGGTGLIGKHLTNRLRESGYDVSLLSRKPSKGNGLKVYKWDPEAGTIDPEAISNADFIIHLAGAGLGDSRWTEKRKKEIPDSRIKSAGLIFAKLKESGKRPEAFVSASGTGYYGSVTSERILAETDDPGKDFTGEVCSRWEDAAGDIESLGIRTVILRTGIVLSDNGGALMRMALPAKFGIGSPLGSGRQYVPWIHIDDICGIYIKAINDRSMTGVYNAAAPEHVSNSQFMRTVSEVMGRPFFFPAIPSFLFRILYGEMSSILLQGTRVSSEKIISSGYSFRYPDLRTALISLL
jgi:uncharacterized protein (TIGR01777 family)